MQHHSIEEKAVGKQQQKKMRKNVDANSPITPNAVLLESSRHNIQTSTRNHAATCLKGKNTIRKADVVPALNKVVENNAKKPAVPFYSAKEGSSSMCLSARKAAREVQASPNSSEVDELKRRLQNANFQIADVVAQSAIVLRDMQCAASKEIANAVRHLHSSSGQEEKGLNQFENFNKKIPISSLNTQIGRGFYYMGVGTSEQELASTRQELADCKLMLADMRRQLERTSSEKEKLEMYLASSVQTSLKLQDTLVNQRSVMQLELLAAEDRARNEAALLVQSARNESKYLQEQLNVALLSKAEADCSLRNCIQLLCHAQRELLTFSALAKQQCCFQLTVQEKLQQLQNSQNQVKKERDNLDEAYAQNAITWTVLECVWEGAVESLLQSGGSHVSEQNPNFETPRLYSKKFRHQSLQAQKYSCSVKEELTPSSRNFPDTPREDGQRRSRSELSPWEDVLRQTLMKSEHEVEILGDKVDELRIILEKVTSLLDCISKSSVTGHETKILMRRIIEQLKAFEM